MSFLDKLKRRVDIMEDGKINEAANITIAVTSNGKNSVVCVNKDTGNITEIKGTAICTF